MNDLPVWIADALMLVGIGLAMWAIIAVLARVVRWAMLRNEPTDYEKWSGE